MSTRLSIRMRVHNECCLAIQIAFPAQIETWEVSQVRLAFSLSRVHSCYAEALAK